VPVYLYPLPQAIVIDLGQEKKNTMEINFVLGRRAFAKKAL
jgi:hypothetical protein